MFEYLVSCYLLNYRRGKSKNEKNCMKRKQYSDKSNVSVLSLLLIEIGKLSFNSFMHKMGPQGPKQHIFRDQLYSKNDRNLRFHVFLLFYARKHKTLSFYLKWTEFTRKFEFFTI